MKTIFTLSMVVLIAGFTSCSKEDDSNCNPKKESNIESQKLNFAHDIQPIIKSSCSANSNCHAVTSRAQLLNSATSFREVIDDGSFSRQLFAENKSTPCSHIDSKSMEILRVWYDEGGSFK